MNSKELYKHIGGLKWVVILTSFIFALSFLFSLYDFLAKDLNLLSKIVSDKNWNSIIILIIIVLVSVVIVVLYINLTEKVYREKGYQLCTEYPGKYYCKLARDYCKTIEQPKVKDDYNEYIRLCKDFGEYARNNIFMTLPNNPFKYIETNKSFTPYIKVRDIKLSKSGKKCKRIYLTQENFQKFIDDFIKSFKNYLYSKKNGISTNVPIHFPFTRYIYAHQKSNYPIYIEWVLLPSQEKESLKKEEYIIFDNKIKIKLKIFNIKYKPLYKPIIDFSYSQDDEFANHDDTAVNTYNFFIKYVFRHEKFIETINNDQFFTRWSRFLLMFEIEKYKVRKRFFHVRLALSHVLIFVKYLVKTPKYYWQ